MNVTNREWSKTQRQLSFDLAVYEIRHLSHHQLVRIQWTITHLVSCWQYWIKKQLPHTFSSHQHTVFSVVILACGDLLHTEIVGKTLNSIKYSIRAENWAVRLWHSITIRFYITSHHIVKRYGRKFFFWWTQLNGEKATLCVCSTSFSVTDATILNWACVWWSAELLFLLNFLSFVFNNQNYKQQTSSLFNAFFITAMERERDPLMPYHMFNYYFTQSRIYRIRHSICQLFGRKNIFFSGISYNDNSYIDIF